MRLISSNCTCLLPRKKARGGGTAVFFWVEFQIMFYTPHSQMRHFLPVSRIAVATDKADHGGVVCKLNRLFFHSDFSTARGNNQTAATYRPEYAEQIILGPPFLVPSPFQGWEVWGCSVAIEAAEKMRCAARPAVLTTITPLPPVCMVSIDPPSQILGLYPPPLHNATGLRGGRKKLAHRRG